MKPIFAERDEARIAFDWVVEKYKPVFKKLAEYDRMGIRAANGEIRFDKQNASTSRGKFADAIEALNVGEGFYVACAEDRTRAFSQAYQRGIKVSTRVQIDGTYRICRTE